MRGLQSAQSPTDNEGVVVDQVMPGSPAAQAKLQPGDVVRKFNGRDVQNITALRKMVGQTELDKNVELEVLRDGKPLKVTTQIKEQPQDYQTSTVSPKRAPSQPQSPSGSNDQDTSSGPLAHSIQVGDLTPEMARQLDLPSNVREASGDERRFLIVARRNYEGGCD